MIIVPLSCTKLTLLSLLCQVMAPAMQDCSQVSGSRGSDDSQDKEPAADQTTLAMLQLLSVHSELQTVTNAGKIDNQTKSDIINKLKQSHSFAS